MEEPLKPPSQQPRRYFDIVPSKHALPPATSRPIVTNKSDNLADPMVVAEDGPPTLKTHHEPNYILTKDSAINVHMDEPNKEEKTDPLIENSKPTSSSEAMMDEEYQEIEHELPSGQALATPESNSSSMASIDSAAMMDKEYQEIEHELPSGEDIDWDKPPQVPNFNKSLEDYNLANATRLKIQHHKSRRKEYIWVLVIIAVLIIAADLLLDSGVWKPGHNLPHTHFWH